MEVIEDHGSVNLLCVKFLTAMMILSEMKRRVIWQDLESISLNFSQEYLIAYKMQGNEMLFYMIDTHENFYRELKRYIREVE